MIIPRGQLTSLKSDIVNIGFASIENSINDALFVALREEALAQKSRARRAVDNGSVSYRGQLADLGEVARAFLTSHPFAEFLRSIFAQRFILSEESSCYTYYGTGDFLSPHRDVADDCLATVLVYLEATSPDPNKLDTGLVLKIYEDGVGKPANLRHMIKTRNGLVVVGRGSAVWHGRPPLLAGEQVVVLTACFSACALI
ncbi:hypothetical protein Q9L42_015370 [Methylomarinum sp. Ch1-1]|uniref:Fe2OG dioxygenase domain-containing protein n=1 Tax=Methylomarinum roseum TaxID=3067653 RepID=A0AAU7NRY8_9GAMM